MGCHKLSYLHIVKHGNPLVKDLHLGNVLEVISDRKWGIDDGIYNPTTGVKTLNSVADGITDYYIADIITYSDYDPFGTMQDNRKSTSTGSSIYNAGFQGQRVDNEIKGEGNSIDYKYRMHDPRIGRFFAVDPLAPKYAHNSPYAFSENKVIDAVELEGLESMDVNLQPSTVDPQLEMTTVKKTNNNGPLNVTYNQLNNQGVVINSYQLPGNGFRPNSVEAFAMNQPNPNPSPNTSNLGLNRLQAMSETTRITNPNGTLSYRMSAANINNSAQLDKYKSGFVGFQYNLSVFYNPDRSDITPGGVQPNQFATATANINRLLNTISTPIPTPGNNGNVIFNLQNFSMMVNGETDSRPSNYRSGGTVCGNPCLGQDRANGLLLLLQGAHPNRNFTNVINHITPVINNDRSSSIFFF